MGFEGDVKDFGLSEIFQLISVQQKSGMLLVSGEGNIAVFFNEGLIISTRDRRNRSSDPLKDYMIRYGFLGREVLRKINRIQEESKLDLTEILISEKYFSEDELRIIFQDQIYETIQEAINWPQSHYKFISGKNLLQGVKSYASIKVDAVLMESMRRIDEFPRLLDEFPSLEMIIRRKGVPEGKLPEMRGNEEFIYELLENSMSLDRIISRGKMARFCVYEALNNLGEKDLIDLSIPHETPEIEIREETKEVSRRSYSIPVMVIAVVIAACFIAGEYLLPAVLPPGWPVLASTEKKDGAMETDIPGIDELKARQLEKKISASLEAYRASKGSYPLTIEILSLKGFTDQETLARYKEKGFSYGLSNNGQNFNLER